MTAGEGSVAAWSAVLDRLEADVILGEVSVGSSQVTVELEPWLPPNGLGPIPESLVARAREIAARQAAVVTGLPSAMERVFQQWELTKKINEATATVRPPSIYIDTRA